ncbi:MAG: hypothetical protein AAF988_05735 [Pseudomonadota bacterium]
MIVLKKIYLTVFVLFVGFGIAQAAPIGIDLDKLKPLTAIEYMPESEFGSMTKLVEDVPYGDKFLSFTVRLPSDFMLSMGQEKLDIDSGASGSLGRQVLGVVSRFISPPKEHLRSFFTLEALELTYEISARNWFINYVVSNGLTLEQVGAGTENEVEAIYVEIINDTTYVVRARAIKNGPRMLMARHYLPQQFYSEDRVLQAQIIRSFELTNKEDVGIEELDGYGFLDQSYFRYPASWDIQVPYIRSINRMQAIIYYNLKEDRLDGQINVFLTNKSVKTSPVKEIEFYRDKAEVEGYKLGSLIERIEATYHPDMKYGVTEVYSYIPSEYNLLDYELWFSFMEGEDYYYVMTLLTPARQADFYTWARNTEAYLITLSELRRNTEGLNYYEFIQ